MNEKKENLLLLIKQFNIFLFGHGSLCGIGLTFLLMNKFVLSAVFLVLSVIFFWLATEKEKDINNHIRDL